MTGPTLASLSADLATGRTTSRALVDECLARIEDLSGEGARAFVRVDREAAIATADALDALRRAGAEPSRVAGIPLAVKDLFDVRGQVTRAGSVVLADEAPARADAPSVARCREAGFVLIGRTNMTEFAYSGLGMNPHHGTPLAPWKREEGRVPGGSSSGAAVAVADGMAHAALGTDTGGSCRIPAAFAGLVGMKPTACRVPLAGVLPLAPSLDSVGPIGRTVACCAALDAILSGEPQAEPDPVPVSGLRFIVPATVALDGLDDTVSRAFEGALARLSALGARIETAPVPEFAEVAGMNGKGGFTAAESFAWHRRLLAARRDGYDPRVAVRIGRGEAMSAADYLDLVSARTSLVARATRRLAPYDAVLMPTVPIVPPRIADLAGDDEYGRVNLLVLRNPTLVNMIDGCAVSVPITRSGEGPVGLMVTGLHGADARILAIAAALEACLSPRGSHDRP